jgi:isochorismate hydrolase
MRIPSNAPEPPSDVFVGRVVLLVVDIQGGSTSVPDNPRELPHMPGRAARARRTEALIARCRERGVPVVFMQEVHKPTLVDIGRELDGAEGPHCIEGWPETELADWLRPRADEYVIRKRRYSSFFGTELEIVLKGYKAETILLVVRSALLGIVNARGEGRGGRSCRFPGRADRRMHPLYGGRRTSEGLLLQNGRGLCRGLNTASARLCARSDEVHAARCTGHERRCAQMAGSERGQLPHG